MKWLVVPRPAWTAMTTISTARATAATVPARNAPRVRPRRERSWSYSQAQVTQKIAMETANLVGLSHTGAPSTSRGSTRVPSTPSGTAAAQTRPTTINGPCHARMLRIWIL